MKCMYEECMYVHECHKLVILISLFAQLHANMGVAGGEGMSPPLFERSGTEYHLSPPLFELFLLDRYWMIDK